MVSLMFPSVGMQVMSSLIHLLGVSLLSHCLSRRLAHGELTRQGLAQMTWPRLCVILVFLDSWLFLFSSGILIFGVGLEVQLSICTSAIFLCITFYTTSKLLIYAFLIEKVHIVWSPTAGVRRFKSPVYILCAVTVALYFVIIALMLFGRIHYFREGDNVCVIGLKPFSSLPLLSYDLYINIFLTALFLWPLVRSRIVNPRVKRVAVRTLVAAGVALTTSTVNMAVLTVLRGQELGWVCLGSCAADVIINALALFWVTGGGSSRSTTGGSGFPDRERHPAAPIPSLPLVLNISSRPSPHSNHHKAGPQAPQMHTPVHEYMPGSPVAKIGFESGRDGHHGALGGGREAVQAPMAGSVSGGWRSVVRLFKKEPGVRVEEHGLQITVTTQFENSRGDVPEDNEDEDDRRKVQPTSVD